MSQSNRIGEIHKKIRSCNLPAALQVIREWWGGDLPGGSMKHYPLIPDELRWMLPAKYRDRYERRLAQYMSQQLRRIIEAELEDEPQTYLFRMVSTPAQQQGEYDERVVELIMQIKASSNKWAAVGLEIPVEVPSHQWYSHALCTVMSLLWGLHTFLRDNPKESVPCPLCGQPRQKENEDE